MATRKPERERPKDIPDIITNSITGKQYEKGKFLGKGGFARCFELTDRDTRAIYAGKIVSKTLLVKDHQKEKMTQEISIHRNLHHKNIVGFESHFEDADNVYILLELCRRRSLMELHKRRRAVTEPEARYFTHQILEACIYLHETKVIHRDLKLGNLFLNDDMEIKVGDFGLATRLGYDGERKRTLCGTPNYIAPEILCKKGHSFEVDVWSLGCILYTLLIGKPPFETSNLKDTYMKIKKNDYHIPSSKVSIPAKELIRKLLHPNPSMRPSMRAIITDPFFSAGFLPTRLPTSCLSMPPLLAGAGSSLSRQPLRDMNTEVNSPIICGNGRDAALVSEVPEKTEDPHYLSDLYTQLRKLIKTKPGERHVTVMEEAEDPASIPVFWVSKWVDYSDKYGLGYQLCDNSVGVLFNDSTRLILANAGDNLQYIERDMTEHLHNIKRFPDALTKKVTLLKYFRNYMNDHLIKAGDNIQAREGDELTRLPFLKTWFRTKKAIILHLSNGTLQINFFRCHSKIIVCPLMGAVTFIDEEKRVSVYKLDLLEQFGCTEALQEKLVYAEDMVTRLQAYKSGSAKKMSAAN